MNVEMINKVADVIEAQATAEEGFLGKVGFNMAHFYGSTHAIGYMPFPDRLDSCGTTACIAGWTRCIALGVAPDREPGLWAGGIPAGFGNDTETAAMNDLGLNYDQAQGLFYGYGSQVELTDIMPLHAVAVLRHLAKTGKVDWRQGEEYSIAARAARYDLPNEG